MCVWPQKWRWLGLQHQGGRTVLIVGNGANRKSTGQLHAGLAFGSLGMRSKASRLRPRFRVLVTPTVEVIWHILPSHGPDSFPPGKYQETNHLHGANGVHSAPRKAPSTDIKIYLKVPTLAGSWWKDTHTSQLLGLLPDWNTYLAKPCISSAGHVGGADSPVSLFRRNVNSKPKPLGPSVPVNLEGIKSKCF